MAFIVLFTAAALFVGFAIAEIAASFSARKQKGAACGGDAGSWVGLSVEPDLYCSDALRLMKAAGASLAAVTVRDRVLGVLRLEDFARIGERDPQSTYVAAIMRPARVLGDPARPQV